MREEGCPINFAAGKPISVLCPGDTFRGRSKIKRFFFSVRKAVVAAGIQDKFLIWQWFFCQPPPSRYRGKCTESGEKREGGREKRKTGGRNKIKESHRWPVTFYRVNVGSEWEGKRREREKNGGGKKCERCARRRIIGICSWGRIQIGPTLECRPASSVVTVIKRSWYPAGSNAHGRVCAPSSVQSWAYSFGARGSTGSNLR